MIRFDWLKVLIVEEIVRNISKLYEYDRKIEYGQSWTNYRHEKESKEVETTCENKHHDAILPVESDEFFFDENISEFCEKFGVFLFAFHKLKVTNKSSI